MKFLKYISLCLVAVLFASCEDKDITYNTQDVDLSKKAQVQVAYYVPVTAAAKNYIHKVEINGIVYENNGSTMITRYNYVPSGSVNAFYATDPGTVTIKLYNTASDEVCVYTGTVNLEAGSRQMVAVYDLTKDPIVIPYQEYPKTVSPSNETCTFMYNRCVNFLFDTEGQPMKGKVQVMLANPEDKTQWTPTGEPIGFGESTEYYKVDVDKEGTGGSGFNTNGYQRRDVKFKHFSETGEDLGFLQYTNSSGKVNDWSDYWNCYIGRRTVWFVYGVLDSSTTSMGMGSVTVL